LDEEDVLGVANRRSTKKPPGGSDKQLASTSDLATSSDVGKAGSKSGSKGGSKTGSASASGKARSLLEEELVDPEAENMRRKMAQRAQFNPLMPPGYSPPNSSPSWIVWAAIGGVVLVVVVIGALAAFWS
jgi:hypothetical protein